MDFTKTLNKISCNRVGNSKTGNEYYQQGALTEAYKTVSAKGLTGDDLINKMVRTMRYVAPTPKSMTDEDIKKEVVHYLKSRYLLKTGNSKVGNYETGTSKFKPGDKVKVYGVHGVVVRIEGENTNNIYGEPLVVVKSDENGKTQAIPEHYVIKVGNSKIDLAKHISVGNETMREWATSEPKVVNSDPKEKELWDEMQEAKKLAEEWAREINRTGDKSLVGSQKDAVEAYKKAKKAYEQYTIYGKK